MIKKATQSSSGSTDLTAIGSDVKATSDNTYALGSTSKLWTNVYATTVTSSGVYNVATGATFTHRSSIANGAAAVGHKFTSTNTLSTSGAKIASFYSDDGSTEKAYVDKDGNIVAGASGAGNLSARTHGDEQNVARIVHYVFSNQAASHYSGRCSDASDAVAHRFGSNTNLTTAGAQIAAFYNDSFSTKKAFIDKDGQLENTVAGKGVILKSPDGTRYLLTIANGGTVSIAAA